MSKVPSGSFTVNKAFEQMGWKVFSVLTEQKVLHVV